MTLVVDSTVTDSSYTFTINTNVPTIVAPVVSSSQINCIALENCTKTIGLYYSSPTCFGEILSYYVTVSNVLTTTTNYYFYTVDLLEWNDYITFAFIPNTEQIGLTYQI